MVTIVFVDEAGDPQFVVVLTGYPTQATWPASLYEYVTVLAFPSVVLIS